MGDSQKLMACLRKLRIQLQMEDFSERKRIQKVVCLLELFGLDMGFNFTWYHYGPYSPDLTRTLFELADKNTSRGGRLNAQEENQIEAFKKFVGDDLKSSDAMELLGSLFFLDKVGKNSNATDEQILSVFKEKKPWFSQEDIANAWSRRSDIEKLWN